MGYYQAGYNSYREYLASDWFRRVKEKAWKRSKGKCAICGKRWDLQPHHLLYESLGKWWEYLIIRYICSRHHKMCSYWLWFIKVPNKWYCIIPTYYFIKFTYLGTHAPIWICWWLYDNYRISGNSNNAIRHSRRWRREYTR